MEKIGIFKRKGPLERRKWSSFTIIILVILLIYSLLLAGLLYWAITTSFKSDNELINEGNYYKWPTEFTFHYASVLKNFTMSGSKGSRLTFWQIVGNTLIYALGSAFFKTLVPCLTAYACARFDFKPGKVVYTAVLVAMVIPIVGSLPSELSVAYSFRIGEYSLIVNNLVGVWVLKANMLGLYFFVMYASFKAMPSTFFEAARIDGANNWQILFHIAFPLIRNVFFTVLLINFVEFWNDYQTPMVYLSEKATLGYSLWYKFFNDSTYSTLPIIMTTTILVSSPVVILFIIFKDRFMGSLTVGGIKG